MNATVLWTFSFAILCLSSPIFARQAPPDALIPEFWTFELISWNGPGCPDYPKYNGTEIDNSATRQSIGPYQFNSSADTWWFYFAYPWMRVDLADISGRAAKSNRTWCESTIRYQEMANDYGQKREEKDSKYKLRMHKNGTTIEAVYKLRDGQYAEWNVTYLAKESEEVLARDYAALQGPRTTKDPNKNDFDFLTPDTKTQFKSVLCASSTFRVKMELRLVSAGMRGEGSVNSKKVDWNNGKGPIWDGANLGLSYDWESCKS